MRRILMNVLLISAFFSLTLYAAENMNGRGQTHNGTRNKQSSVSNGMNSNSMNDNAQRIVLTGNVINLNNLASNPGIINSQTNTNNNLNNNADYNSRTNSNNTGLNNSQPNNVNQSGQGISSQDSYSGFNNSSTTGSRSNTDNNLQNLANYNADIVDYPVTNRNNNTPDLTGSNATIEAARKINTARLADSYGSDNSTKYLDYTNGYYPEDGRVLVGSATPVRMATSAPSVDRFVATHSDFYYGATERTTNQAPKVRFWGKDDGMIARMTINSRYKGNNNNLAANQANNRNYTSNANRFSVNYRSSTLAPETGNYSASGSIQRNDINNNSNRNNAGSNMQSSSRPADQQAGSINNSNNNMQAGVNSQDNTGKVRKSSAVSSGNRKAKSTAAGSSKTSHKAKHNRKTSSAGSSANPNGSNQRRSATSAPSAGNYAASGVNSSPAIDKAYGFVTGSGSNAQVYLVFNKNGKIANDELSNYTGKGPVRIEGTVRNINGLNVIYMDRISPGR